MHCLSLFVSTIPLPLGIPPSALSPLLFVLGDIMAEFTISPENLKNFLTSLGKDLTDIMIKVGDGKITAAVGKTTHYIKREMDCGTAQSGNVYVSDLTKLKAFVNAAKGSEVKVNQVRKTGTLHASCGKSSLQLPTSSYIQSQDKVSLIERLIEQSVGNMWSTWSNQSLNYHAVVSGEALKPASSFSKVLGSKYACKTEFDPSSSEFIIRGGNSQKGKMFVKSALTNVDAPEVSARSAFDNWLPELLTNLPKGDFNLYTGDETVLVLEQPDINFLMVVIDQEYEED